jgi:hypothetical protein
MAAMIAPFAHGGKDIHRAISAISPESVRVGDLTLCVARASDSECLPFGPVR